MRNLKNVKGFTIVEVIVTLAIIGIILIIALPRLVGLKDSNNDKKYDAYRDSILAASKLYVDDEGKDMFGNYSSGCKVVSYQDLKDKNLVKDFGDSNVKVNIDDTFVLGPGLIDAYKLESQKAKFPRIIVDERYARECRERAAR